MGPNTTLREALNLFQTGASHLAFVSKNPSLTSTAVTEFHDKRFELNQRGATISKTPASEYVGVCIWSVWVGDSPSCAPACLLLGVSRGLGGVVPLPAEW